MGLEGEEAKHVTGVMAFAKEWVIRAVPKAVREGCSDLAPKTDPARSFRVSQCQHGVPSKTRAWTLGQEQLQIYGMDVQSNREVSGLGPVCLGHL